LFLELLCVNCIIPGPADVSWTLFSYSR
jgi:hypothetical protein